MSMISRVTIVVDEYSSTIEFFVDVLGFELVEDTPSLTNDGREKRWVVVRPPGAETAILLARADGERLWPRRRVPRHRRQPLGPARRLTRDAPALSDFSARA
jgi:catechol 2,3-dioxygenase-like lactoylglutathione lyase family enzyme